MKYKVIKSKEQYDQYCDTLEQLLVKTEHEDEIELLTLLIESWDRDHNSVDDVDNVTMLRFLMQEHGLKEVDLGDIVGVGRGLVFEVLNKKRALSSGMARELAKHFKVFKNAFDIRPQKNTVRNDNWLSSEDDQRVFFNALMNPSPPNEKLKQAANKPSKPKSKE